MPQPETREVWLRGTLPDVPPLLQPVAHALLQAREDVNELTHEFPDQLLWIRLCGVASVGFHLQHLSGVLDRLFTYAAGRALSPEQLRTLSAEGDPDQTTQNVRELTLAFNRQIDQALAYLNAVDESTLNDARGVGRAQLPSTVFGLLVHAAEHVQRHVGQLLVMVRILQGVADPTQRSLAPVA
jgi:uncharacterized damage-inducible protein DinB